MVMPLTKRSSRLAKSLVSGLSTSPSGKRHSVSSWRSTATNSSSGPNKCHSKCSAWLPRLRSAETPRPPRSEEHTSELQSLMRISYAVFCLNKKNTTTDDHQLHHNTKH